MGAWGPGLYQDDVALDIKEEYIDLLHKGKTKEEACEEVVCNNQDYLEDEEDVIPMVLALADTQWKYGKLMDPVKQDALSIIESGIGLKAWEENPKYLKRRKEVLQKLKEKLESPQPPEKHLKPVRLYKCEWEMKGAYAYKLESDLAKEKGLYGRYIIFIKVDEDIWHPGHIIPIVWVKITDDDKLPKNEEELDKLEYIQILFTDYIELFCRIRFPDPENKAEVESLKYNVNENYELPIYRTSLISTSKRIIPKKIIYLGVFPKISPPKNEFVLENKISYYSIVWNHIENDIIFHYCFNNKGEKYKELCNRERREKNKKLLEEKGYDFNRIK